jgi:hypothetical protein
MPHPLTTLAILALSAGIGSVAQAQGAPQPTAEHKRLGYFVGKWSVEGEMKPGPMGPGGKYTATDSCDWFEGGFSVVCRSEGRMPTGPAKSMGILSYSTEEKAYTYYGTDNMGMTMASVAKGTLQGDTWTYTDESMMGGQKIKSRVLIKELSPTSHTFKMEIQTPNGKWVPVMEAKNTKS